MARLILHIGTHKTGTTALQNTLAVNRKRLARIGILYPAIGRASGHHGIARKWSRGLPAEYALSRPVEDILRELARTHGRGEGAVILSSEEFSRGEEGGRTDFRELVQLLSGFEDIRVVFAVREQAGFLQAIYQEISRPRIPAPWAEFLARALATGRATGLDLDHGRILDRLEPALDPARVRVIDHVSARSRPGGIVTAFLEAAEIDLGGLSLEPVPPGFSNPSPNPLVTWVMNRLAVPRPAAGVQALIERALEARLGQGRRTRIATDAEILRIREHWAEANRRFVDRVRRHQPRFALMPEALSKLPSRETLDATFWEHLARLLLHERHGSPPATRLTDTRPAPVA